MPMSKSINSAMENIPYTGSNHFGAVLSDFIKASFDVNLEHEILCYRLLLVRRISSNGKKEAAKFLKALYNYAVKISLDYTDVDPLEWTKSNKRGFPKCISTFEKYLRSKDYSHRRAALTVLRQYETIFCRPEPDFESISKEGPDPSVWDPFRVQWKDFIENNFKRISPPIKDELMHMTAHNGPNGPAMIRSHIDALAINQDIKLIQAIFGLYSLPVTPTGEPVRVPRFERKLKVFESALHLGEKLINNCKSPILHSRLQSLAVGGCKTRTIAIVDFFSQDALRPLHKWAYCFLSRLSTDGTYSHNRVSQIVCDATLRKKASFCFDLTNATDRFPVFLQTEFLEVVIDRRTALSWKSVICDRKFAVPGSPDSLEYKCGQPMGALSSWAIFALTHHAIVEFCAFLQGYKSFREYVIIGDDVAIFNERVASKYKEILELLEVPISESKSISSKRNSKSSRGEIAKRLFLNGLEISPVPTGAIYSAWKDVLLFPNLVRLCQERGVESFYQIAPVHQLSSCWYSISNVDRVGALLFCPLDPLLRSNSDNNWNPWEQYSLEEISIIHREVLKKRLTDKADRVYKDLLIEINDDPVWGGLMDNPYDPDLPLHPMSLMWRSIRDKISESYIKLKTTKDLDPAEIEFILDPLLRDYRRKSHRRFRIKGILIQRTLEKLRSPTFEDSSWLAS